MSKVAIKGADTGTGVFTLESPATNTDRTLTLPDEAGTVLTTATPGVAISGPAFSAHLSANFSVTSDVITKVPLNVVDFDTASCFNNTGSTVNGIPAYAFMPNVAGYYQFNSVLGSAASSLNYSYCRITKNGTLELYSIYGPYSGNTVYGAVAGLLYMNGTTDYVELYAGIQGSGIVVSGHPTFKNTFLSAALVRAD
jgi:hypothetical protein